jgi:hypothetical protein
LLAKEIIFRNSKIKIGLNEYSDWLKCDYGCNLELEALRVHIVGA